MNETAAGWVIAILVLIIWGIMMYVVLKPRFQKIPEEKRPWLSKALYPFTVVVPIYDGISILIDKSKEKKKQGGWINVLPPYPQPRPTPIEPEQEPEPEPEPEPEQPAPQQYTGGYSTYSSYVQPTYDSTPSYAVSGELEAPPDNIVFGM